MSDTIQFPESKLSRSIELSGQLRDELAKNEIGVPPTPVGTAGTDDPSKSKGEALAPIPAVLSPLHELESSLLAFLDTEDCVTEEQEQAFLADLSRTMQATVAKRDRVAAFIKHCEARADECANEIKRLHARKRTFDSAAERVRNYVLWIIEALSPGPDGKYKKLEGNKFTFSTRKIKPRLEITEEADVPATFKSACIEMPAEQYTQYRKVFEALGIELSVETTDFAVDESRLRTYLEGAPQPCADCNGSGIVQGRLISGFISGIDSEAVARNEADYQCCPTCRGFGVIHPSVPGARLLTERNALVIR